MKRQIMTLMLAAAGPFAAMAEIRLIPGVPSGGAEKA